MQKRFWRIEPVVLMKKNFKRLPDNPPINVVLFF